MTFYDSQNKDNDIFEKSYVQQFHKESRPSENKGILQNVANMFSSVLGSSGKHDDPRNHQEHQNHQQNHNQHQPLYPITSSIHDEQWPNPDKEDYTPLEGGRKKRQPRKESRKQSHKSVSKRKMSLKKKSVKKPVPKSKTKSIRKPKSVKKR